MMIIKIGLLAGLMGAFSGCPQASASIANSSTLHIEQDKARYPALTPDEQTYSSSQAPTKPENIVFPQESICRKITKINIKSDDGKLTEKLLGKLTQQAINKCLGIKGIRLLARTLQNELIIQGYINSLIDIPPQSLNSGELQLNLVWGNVGEIACEPDAPRPTSLWSSIPMNTGDTLRLASLEQDAGTINSQDLVVNLAETT